MRTAHESLTKHAPPHHLGLGRRRSEFTNLIYLACLLNAVAGIFQPMLDAPSANYHVFTSFILLVGFGLKDLRGGLQAQLENRSELMYIFGSSSPR